MKRNLRFSLIQLSAHSFLRSMRKSRQINDVSSVLLRLADNQHNQEKEVTRWLALSLVAIVWLATSETPNVLQMQQLGISVIIPRMGVVFAAALFLGLSILHTASLLVVAGAIESVLQNVVRVDEPATLSPLYDPGGSFLAPFLKEFRFFVSGKLHNLARIIIVFLVLLVAAGIYCLAVLLLAFEASTFLLYGSSWATCVLAVLTLIILVVQVALQLVLYVPIKFSRNDAYIRWNFLVTLVYKKAYHPKAPKWLEKI